MNKKLEQLARQIEELRALVVALKEDPSVPKDQIAELESGAREADVVLSEDTVDVKAVEQQIAKVENLTLRARLLAEIAAANTEGIDWAEFIEANWAPDVVTTVELPFEMPVTGNSKTSRMRFHKDGQRQLAQAFKEIDERQLTSRIVEFCGSFVPRYYRGAPGSASKPPASRLSTHALGIAFDINCTANPSGEEPTAGVGSVLDLVPIFEAHGFTWGGRNSRPDAMHFELAYFAPVQAAAE